MDTNRNKEKKGRGNGETKTKIVAFFNIDTILIHHKSVKVELKSSSIIHVSKATFGPRFSSPALTF